MANVISSSEIQQLYRGLLKKYIKHVEDCEGTNFINQISFGVNYPFSEEEVKILCMLELENAALAKDGN